MQHAFRKINPVLAASVLALFANSSVWAESKADQQLPQVEVVGTSPLPGIGIERDKLPYDVQSVTAETVARSNTLNLTEYMAQNMPGVNVNEVQGSPFQADVTYRGARASSILGSAQGLSVYMDGVRVNEPFGDVVNWDMLPESAFASVTLVPGSNPIYGLNTLGGALAFTTKSGLTAPGTEVKLTAGSFGRKRADVSYGSKSEDGWHSFIAATAFDENGWREHSAGSLGNVFAKIGKTQGDVNWDLSLLVARSKILGNALLPDTNFGADGSAAPSAHMYQQNFRSVYTYPDQTENQLNMLTFNIQRMFDSETELASTTYLRQSSRHAFSGDVSFDAGHINAIMNYNTTSQTSYGTSLNLTKLLDKHQITTGASIDASHMRYGASAKEGCVIDPSRAVLTDGCLPEEDTAGVNGKSLAIGLYASDTWNVASNTYLTTAARFNHASVSNTLTGQSNESFSYNSLNPSMGLSHKLTSTVTVFGNLGQSNRVPTVIELGCADPLNPCKLPIGLQADPYLKQVIARTFETGMRWNASADTGASLAVYRTENRDDILFRTATVAGAGYFSNFSRTRYQGIDLSGFTKVDQFDLRASYSYLDATYQADGTLFGGERDIAVTPGTRIAGLPRHTLKLHADWHATPKMLLGASVITTSSLITQGNEDGLVGDGTTVTQRNASVSGYTLLNLNANYEAQKGLDYFMRVNNVLNRRFETYGMMGQSLFDQNGADQNGTTVNRFVAPGAPRSFMLGLRYKY
jgi:outer membrane receptor protein involved in Fe transport